MKKPILDTVQTDSMREIRKYTWMGAKVVGSTVNTQVNFITIHRGSATGCASQYGCGQSAGHRGYSSKCE